MIDLSTTGSAAAVDLNTCDLEPIHIPGSIQAHGLLLVAGALDRKVIGGAGDIEGRLAPDWLGRTVDDLLGIDDLESMMLRRASSISLGLVKGLLGTFACTLHRSEDRILVELETAPSKMLLATDVLADLEVTNRAFERAISLRDLCERAAVAFRELTGFDRVMVYRFLDDEAGVVVAEDRDPALKAFLHHHFPAADIPKQARALYVRNKVRTIPDVHYKPAPLRPAKAGLAKLDLSAVVLRSVSPVHLQYLRNMGVQASASISIVKDGVLWGLIACHNATPRELPFTVRLACDALASGLSRQIRAKDEAEAYREQIRLRSAEDTIVSHLKPGIEISDVLRQQGALFAQMLGADGFAAIYGAEISTSGRCPDRADLREIGRWVTERAIARPYYSHRFGADCKTAEDLQELASGVLAATLSSEEPVVLMWFRAEHLQVVEWAGNPHKAISVKPGEVLTPRASFEAWSEAVRGQSRPWSLAEVEAASRVRSALFDFRQVSRIRDLNRELAVTVSDKESLLAQKDYLIKEINHRVQNSLQLVASFLTMQSRSAGDATLTAHLDEARRRLSAVALVHRRLYAGDRVETIDLARYLDDLCAELKISMGAAWASQIVVDFAPALITTDRAVNVGLVLTELMINANKYAYGGAPGPIAISLELARSRFRLIVADRGSGKVGRREGFGTRMLNALVQQLDGTLDETKNDPGLRVILTAPLAN